MVFNLAKLKQNSNVIVTNKDEVFQGTDLENQNFEIVVKRLTRSEKIDVASIASKEDGTISAGEYSKALFVASIEEIKDIKDENGQELDAGFLWEYAPDVLIEEIKTVIQSFNKAETEKKSDFNPTQIG